MAVANTLQALQAEIENMHARDAELTLRIRKGEMVELESLRRVTVERAHRVRELLLTAPHREAATLAARFSIEPALLHVALSDLVREFLREISASGRALRSP
jgi:hypothetical protein